MNLRSATNLEVSSARDENGNLLIYSCNILNRWENCFSQLFKYTRGYCC